MGRKAPRQRRSGLVFPRLRTRLQSRPARLHALCRQNAPAAALRLRVLVEPLLALFGQGAAHVGEEFPRLRHPARRAGDRHGLALHRRRPRRVEPYALSRPGEVPPVARREGHPLDLQPPSGRRRTMRRGQLCRRSPRHGHRPRIETDRTLGIVRQEIHPQHLPPHPDAYGA